MPKTPARFNIPEFFLKLAFTRQLKEKNLLTFASHPGPPTQHESLPGLR